jgi:hypothetical protein
LEITFFTGQVEEANLAMLKYYQETKKSKVYKVSSDDYYWSGMLRYQNQKSTQDEEAAKEDLINASYRLI